MVVLSRHCEDFVLLYHVMQGLVPIGTGYDASMTADRVSLSLENGDTIKLAYYRYVGCSLIRLAI